MTSPLKRIMLIEDEPDIREIVRLSLEEIGGYTVQTHGSGDEAIQRVGRFAPDLILLDAMMPGMDGPGTLTALRQIPSVAATPVVFLTAKVQSQEIARFKNLGALDVIHKPFDPMTLAHVLQGIWERNSR